MNILCFFSFYHEFVAYLVRDGKIVATGRGNLQKGGTRMFLIKGKHSQNP